MLRIRKIILLKNANANSDIDGSGFILAEGEMNREFLAEVS
jgi:hypothetical protein